MYRGGWVGGGEWEKRGGYYFFLRDGDFWGIFGGSIGGVPGMGFWWVLCLALGWVPKYLYLSIS